MSQTLVEIRENIVNDLKTRLNITDNQLKKVVDALANTLAGQFKLMDLRISDIQKNLFPDTADTAENGGELERLGQLYLGRNPFLATEGRYQISVVAESGSGLRSGITFKSNEDSESPGELYVLDNEFTASGTNDVFEVRSLNTGINVQLNVGDQLTITEPVLGIDQLVTVANVIQQPKAAETTQAYRTAILQAIQLEPQGGSRTDYVLWGKEAQGVANIFPYVKDNNSGTVQVYVEATEVDSLDSLGTPTEAILSDVVSVVNTDPVTGLSRKPILAGLEVLPIELSPVDVVITGLEDNGPSVISSIQDSIKSHLKTVRPFVDGANLLINRNDVLFAAKIQSVVTDVLDSGNFFRELSISVNGVGQISTTFSRENIPYLRNLTINNVVSSNL